MAGWLFLIVALLGVLAVANAAWPRRGPLLLVPSWALAFLTTDLAPFHFLLQLVLTAGFVAAGALASLPGKLALILLFVSAATLFILWLPNLEAKRIAADVADALHLDETESMPRRLLLTPVRKTVDGVVVTRDVEYFRAAGRALKLDVYRSSLAADQRPALLYLHGGGWVVGDKANQGRPLCNHLASLGWVCLNANYRLSPAATYPDPVVDAKAAIAWLRDHADGYGVDPSFVAIAGGSAGAHIAAMAALTPGDRSLQPGFEDADASLQAVVTFYGAYDLTNRNGSQNPEFATRMIGPYVIKAFPDTEPERFSAASPLDHVQQVTMPWLVVQGGADTLTPPADAREFAIALEQHSDSFVGYVEFPGAQHAFDLYYSPRAIAAVELSARFLITAHRRATSSRAEK